MIIKKHLIRWGKKIFSLINNLIPKNKNKVIFRSRPDVSGNAKAFSDYLITNQKAFEVIWLVENEVFLKSDPIKYVKKGSFSALLHYVTSRYIVTTHNEIIGTKANSQVYISLWHGMPLKKIAYLSEQEYIGMEDFPAKRIATSEVMRSIIAAAFHEKASNVYITGQPRNDYLFHQLSIDVFDKKNKKTILYAPTFRENQNSGGYSDGEAISESNFLRVPDFDIDALDRFLEHHDAQLLIKLHPFEENAFIDVTLTRNIKIIRTSALQELGLDINHLLRDVDILITDYSSVYFDYMLLNRPIIFVIPDLDSYSTSRGGFALQPVDWWMPGAHTDNQDGLQKELQKLLCGKDEYLEKREVVNNIINYYKDGKSSERVFKKFFE